MLILPASMASLIFALGFFTYGKVKDKRDEKKAKKRRAYEQRYLELEREHTQEQQRYRKTKPLSRSQSGPEQLPRLGTDDGKTKKTDASDPAMNPFAEPRSRPRSSEESQRSDSSRGSSRSRHSEDGPAAWVDEVVKAQQQQQQPPPPHQQQEQGQQAKHVHGLGLGLNLKGDAPETVR